MLILEVVIQLTLYDIPKMAKSETLFEKNYSLMRPSVVMVTTCQGRNLPLS